MKELLEDFRETIEKAAARLLLITEEESERARAEGKWSAKEVIGHLIDSASNNHQRFVRAQFQEDLVFQGYQQDDWVRAQRYNHEPWPLLVQLWKSYNLHLLHLMAVTPEDARKRPRAKHNLYQIAWEQVPEDEPATLEYFMRDYIGHLKNHLRQVLN
ncbi:MAG TPA: DinB family protein [Pyrinomonadaceae bacterium]